MSMSLSLVYLFALPAVSALVLWLVGPSARASRNACLAISVGNLLLAFRLVSATSDGTVIVHAFGGWSAPFGIAFAADRLSATFVTTHDVLLVVVLAALIL